MSLEHIAATYRVPAKEGGRVRYTGGGAQKTGTIIGSRNAHLRIKMDDGETGLYHPTWEMEYLPEGPAMPAIEPEPATCLVEAMRQYLHNDGSGVVFGYEKEAVDRYIAGLEQQHHRDSAELRRLCQARDQHLDGRLDALERALKAEADASKLRDLTATLANFALELIDGASEGNSFDGGEIQSMAEECGLLTKEARTEPCGKDCGCEEFGFPAECYVVTPELTALRKQGASS